MHSSLYPALSRQPLSSLSHDAQTLHGWLEFYMLAWK